jgi:predicted MFS family arabinose efflux permease
MANIEIELTDSAAKPKVDMRIVGATLAGFCTFLDLYTTQSLLPLFRHIFHASEVAVSLTVSATTLSVAFSAPIIGLVADRVGRKRVIVASIFGLIVPTLLAATSTNLSQLIFWRFLQGLFLPGIFSVSMAYINEEFAGGGAGKGMSAYITGNVTGGFMGRFLSGLIAAHFGWRIAFLAIGIVNLIGGILVWKILPPSRNFTPSQSWGSSLSAFYSHFRNKALLATYAVGFSVLFAQVATFTYVSFYLAAPPFNLGTASLGSLFLVYLLGIVITPLGGRIIDRYGHRNLLIMGVAASCIGILFAMGHVLIQEIIALAILASGVFLSQVAGSSHVGVSTDKARSAASGLYVMSYYLGGTFGALAPGYFWKVAGWRGCVALIVAVQLITISIALLWWAPGRAGSISSADIEGDMTAG